MQEVCYHCGLSCDKDSIRFDEKNFCCNGCKSVYEILNTDSLKNYYELNQAPGLKPTELNEYEFDFLDEPSILEKLWLYQDDETAIVRLKIPVIHCTSCVWVLESLNEIKPGIRQSQVQFTQKTIQINYNPNEISLKEIAIFLTELGYKPVISLEDEHPDQMESFDKKLLIKLGIAGFCFGNVMLFAFPEYFTEFKDSWFEQYKYFFRYLMLFLSLPVVFYCAQSYFKSAFTGLKNRFINIDVPISLGIAVLFFRSIYEVAMDLSSGYFDSLCGLVFFMLIGKYFQQNTYKSLSFDRNYKSFYPISITKLVSGTSETIMLSQLKKGDRILVRNGEMVPADAILIKGEGLIDNSFITGESIPIEKKMGDKIFAGGKHKGSSIELEVIKNVDQSYLTSLWQNSGKNEQQAFFSTLIENISRYFTIAILLIALLGGIAWYFINPQQLFQVVTAVLIVACPCALALSTPFTLGNMMRILGLQQIYIKDITTLEKINTIDEIILDKTGTLTETQNTEVKYEGVSLSHKDYNSMYSAFQHSTHPLSRTLSKHLDAQCEALEIASFNELEGKGIEVQIDKDIYQMGSKAWLNIADSQNDTAVYVVKNGAYLGKFILSHRYREGLHRCMDQLQSYKLSILSGDNENERQKLVEILGNNFAMLFNQSPEDKMKFIQSEQKLGHHIMMVGDGLNDAAALQQSNIGIAITDDVNNFTPASDVIMKGNKLTQLPALLKLSRKGVQLVKYSMIISLLYNIIGLGFALAGMLSPLVAAILMPISSISVVLFASVSTWYFGRKYFK